MKREKAISQLNKLKKLAPQNLRLAAEWNKPWHILIATILSAQNRDQETIKVCNTLFKSFKTPEKLSKASLPSIQKIIKPINYYKTKSKHIKETAKIISKTGIPKKIEDLLHLPGVGRKTANVYLAVAHKKQAIGVDTHVARISKKLGWTKSTNVKVVEKDLEKLFPKRYWRSINYILVRFGQTHGRSKTKEDEILKTI